MGSNSLRLQLDPLHPRERMMGTVSLGEAENACDTTHLDIFQRRLVAVVEGEVANHHEGLLSELHVHLNVASSHF